jgi:hypothetical protein
MEKYATVLQEILVSNDEMIDLDSFSQQGQAFIPFKSIGHP